jgi:anti-sigma B factor antagonist
MSWPDGVQPGEIPALNAADVPGAEQLLTVSVQALPTAVIVTVVGEVDGWTVDRLRVALGQALDQPGERAVVVDLTRVSFLGSVGLGALVQARREARARREALRVVVDHQRPVLRPLQLTGLDEVLALYETVSEAVAGERTNPIPKV